MKLSAKTGVALTITALSLVGTVGAGATRPADPAEEDPFINVTQLPGYPAHVDLMNQLRNLTEANAIKWGWSQGLVNDKASAGMTQSSGGADLAGSKRPRTGGAPPPRFGDETWYWIEQVDGIPRLR